MATLSFARTQSAAAASRTRPAWHPSGADRGERLRIAMVAACPLPARRGTPLRIERLAEALIRRGHDVQLIAYPVAGVETPMSVPVVRPFNRCWIDPLPPGPSLRRLFGHDLLLALTVGRTLRRERFDLVHAHHVEGMLAACGAAHRAGVPLVFDAHTLLESELPTFFPSLPLRRLISRIGARLDGAVAHRAEHVIAVTGDIRNALIERHQLPSERVTVARNGVEIERFGEPARTTRADPMRVIYSGTLAPYQGIELLLRAFARAADMRPELRLTLSVSTPFAPYERLARELGVRGAIEVIEDDFDILPALLATAAIAVLPRVHCDGIPQKLLNYMAAGKAVIASAGSAKLIEHERTGLVVRNDDVDGFAAALVRLVDEPRLAAALGARAQQYVSRNCSWDAAAALCEDVYRSVAMAGANEVELAFGG